MKANFFSLIMTIVVILVFSGCGEGKKTNQQDNQIQLPKEEEKKIEEKEVMDISEEKVDYSDWQAYANKKFGYRINHPKNWFFLKDNCCPPPPASVNFNNISDKKEVFVQKQTDLGTQSISIDCLYEGKIDDIGEVALQKKEGKSFENIKINDFEAIVFNEDRGPGQPIAVFTWYIVDGQQGCRLTYDSNCTVCRSIINSFNFKK